MELAAASYLETKREIDEASLWVKDKLDWILKLKEEDLAEDYEVPTSLNLFFSSSGKLRTNIREC